MRVKLKFCSLLQKVFLFFSRTITVTDFFVLLEEKEGGWCDIGYSDLVIEL